MDISHLLDQLNDKQREAVSAGLINLQILAGAGSGKTRVLVHRIAWLMMVENLSPFNILAVTFTNKAAKEMRSRIENMVGSIAQQMWVGTFHSLAHKLLRLHWQEAKLSQNFQVIDADDQYRLIRRIMRDMNLDDSKWPPKQAQWYINSKKEEGLRVKDLSEPFEHFDQVMLRIYQRYEELCEQGELVDFSELLLRAYELWHNSLETREHYQKRFRYILVDEFQDTNSLQYKWLKLLSTPSNHIMIVGDDDQSIYSWRGARVDNMFRFTKDYSDVKTIRLEQNYRSTANILNAANALISNNDARLGKKLWTSSDEGERISLYAGFNETDEARFIVDRINQWQAQGGKLSECAILYRSNAQSRVLEEAFIQAGIPYRIYGGLKFFERAEIKDALAYLRLIENRNDDTALERIINTPTRGIGLRTVTTLREEARNYQQSLWQTIQNTIDQKTLPSRTLNALEVFVNLINTLIIDTKELDLPEQIEHIIFASGLKSHYQKEKGAKAQARLENLAELTTAAKQFIPEDTQISKLTAFLTHAALEAGETQAEAYTDCAQLMTMHMAKGLEFSMVFLAGMEEGLFPHQMSMNEAHGLEEERRLCYVGITRAMKKLYLTYAESRFIYGKTNLHSPSRFISELPHECLQDVRMRTSVSLPLTQRTSNLSTRQNSSRLISSPYKIGQAVKHAKFGDGIILNIEGDGERTRLQINFYEAGSKWLMASVAKLEV